MFGTNTFGALAMDESTPQAGPSTRQIDGDEVDADWIKLIKTNHEVYVRVSEKLDLEGLPDECNLMAVSNIWDLLIVGGSSDVRIHRLSDIHKLLEDSPKDALPISSPLRILPLPARPVWIRLAMGEERLVVATADGSSVCLFKLKDVLGGDTSPYHTFTSDLPRNLLNLLPNPARPSPSDKLSQYVTLLAKEGLVIADVEECKLSAPLSGPFTSACWSAKGKQIVVGTPSGTLVQYTPESTPKAQIPAPPDLDAELLYYPTFIQWLENDLFLVCYAQANGVPEDPLEIFVIQRQKDALTYTKYYDLLDTMGVPGRSSAYRHFAGLKSWGQRTKHLGFLISGLASEIGVMHGGLDGTGQVKWDACILEETARGVMPAAKKGVTDDTSVLALELDLTSDKVISRGIEGGVELPDLPPAPRLLAYSQEGLIISFNIIHPDGGAYPGMVKPQDITSGANPTSIQEDAMDLGTGVNTPAKAEPPKSAFGGFGSTAFGSTTTPTKTPSFGGSAFGQSSTPAPAFGSSAFGQAAPQPSTTPSTTQAASKTSGFGQSAFGQSATPSSTPSAFGQPVAQPSFGQSSTPSGFGHSAFGQPAKPAFGASTFGQPSASGSAFGQPGFGKSPTPSSSPSPAFGSSSTPSAPSAFAGFGSKPAASPSAFGSTAFGQPAVTPSVGPKTEASAFGASKTPTAFGSNAFGSSTGSAFGTAAFGAQAGDSKSAFGGFGKPASPAPATEASSAFAGFGSKPKAGPTQSAFAGFGQSESPKSAFSASTPPAEKSAPPPASNDDFGLGGFASALGESTKAGVPGLEESPPGSPILLGVNKPSGLEDDTPPNSPPPVTRTPQAAAPPLTGSSFIKPATAFGGSTSSGWGAFTQTSKTGGAFGSSSTTPAAFSTPPPAQKPPTSGTAFGQTSTPGSGSAFGQSSKSGLTSTFGTPATAFGQSSKPVGFGQSSTPAPSPSFNNITGGFGSFAAKPSTTTTSEGKSLSGFGGFAKTFTSNSAVSPFGDKSHNSSFANLLSGDKKEPAKSSSVFKEKKEEKIGEVISVPPSETSTAESDTPTPVAQAGQEDTPPKTPTVDQDVAPQSDKRDLTEPTKDASRTPSSVMPDNIKQDAPDVDEAVKVEHNSPCSSEEAVLVEHEGAESEDDEAGSEELQDPEDQEQYEEEYTEEDYAEEYEEENEEENEDQEDEKDEEDEEDEEAEDQIDAQAVDTDEAEREESSEGDEATTRTSRRRSSSIAPEMSPIKEEPAELEQSHQETTKSPKSPPPWFAQPTPTSATPPSATPSLFSRLGPPPPSSSSPVVTPQPAPIAPTPISAAQKLPPAFNLRHAARTSSPLGTHPPQIGSSTSPESPAKGAQVEATKTAGAPAFNFFAAKEDDKKNPAPLFSAPSESKAGFGLGLGKPPSAPIVPTSGSPANQASPFSFAGFGGNQTAAVSSSLSPSPQSHPIARTESPVQGYSVPEGPQSIPPPVKSVSFSSFTVPQRSGVQPTKQPRDDGARSMAAVLERLISDLLADIQNLKATLDANAAHHRAFDVSTFITVTAADLHKHKSLPFSSVDDIKAIVDDLAGQLRDIRAGSSASELKLSDLQSRLLKSDMKSGQADKFLKARQDPSFARVMQVKDLSPEQAASQIKLRKAAQAAETRLTELEAGIVGLKKRLDRRESARHTNSPALDRVQRSVRNVDAAIRDRAATIDDLSERISSIRLATPPRSRRQTTVPLTPSRDSPSVPSSAPVSFDPPTAIREEVERSLDAQAALKARLAGRKVTKLTTLEISKSPKKGILTHASIVNGPIMIDAVPPPGVFSPTKTPSKQDTSTLAVKAETAPSASGFAGLKFSLDPGDFTPTSASSRTRTTGGSTRSHAPAAKFTASPTASAAAPSMSFTPPPPSAPSARDAPSGFFSLTGYANR